MKIIGLSGKARTGKNEVAHIFATGYNFKIVEFAFRLKHFAIEHFGLTKEECFDKKTPESRRILQGLGMCARNEIYTKKDDNQKGKSEYPLWVENFAEKYFYLNKDDIETCRKKLVKIILKGIYFFFKENRLELERIANGNSNDIWINYLFESLNNNEMYIISDVRFKNELDSILNRGGKIIKVERNDKPEIEFGSDHQSETELDGFDKWDYIIINEHKNDWRDVLSQQILNIIGDLKNNNFFSKEELERFNVVI